MSIFRRRSKNKVNQTPVLEASRENQRNVVVSSENKIPSNTRSTSFSNRSSGDEEIDLAQAFSGFSVKLDEKDSNVLVSLDIPSNVPADDLSVKVDDGILRVCGATNSPKKNIEQAFQLDEQSLQVDRVTANLSNGKLTIKAPKKIESQVTRLDSVDILSKKPPMHDKDAFLVIVNVPGVHLEDIHVSYANGKLCIAGNRHFGRNRSFKRTIPVDTQKFDADRLQTFLHEGQLTVVVPQKEESFIRTIKIQTRGATAA